MIKLVDISAQHHELEYELEKALSEILKGSAFIGGAPVSNFEKAFANFCQKKFAVGVSNGTSALEIALRGNQIGYGDEVITVANTFFATAEAIYNVGAKPVFVDVDLIDGLIDISMIEKVITPKTKAIIPVHLFGHLVDMERLSLIAKKFNLLLIEDAAQAHGAVASWGTPGQYSQAAAYSFYPGKNLGAWGDAGAITTNDSDLYLIYSKLRDHGRLSKYEHDLIGSNARMDGLQAAILEVKLSRLSSWNQRRSEIAAIYLQELQDAGFKVLVNPDSYQSAWHLFVVRVNNREEIQKHFKEIGIETGIHYPIPLHKQPALLNHFKSVVLPNTERLAKEIISIPIHPHLSESEVTKILKNFLLVAGASE